jgi:hypothetical protein
MKQISTVLFSIFVLASFARADAPQDIPLTDKNLFLSPYCWRIDDSGAAIAPAAGGYLKFKMTGTATLALRVNTAINKGLSALQMPAVKAVVSDPGSRDGAAQYVQFPANTNADTPVTIATGLNPQATYDVTIQAVGGDETAQSGWSGTIFQTQINRIEIDAGGKLAPATLRPKRALFLGASYEQAYFGFSKPDVPIYTFCDASLSWPFFVAYGLDCEYGQVGIGTQGWIMPGNGGYPPFPAAWDHFDVSHAKSFTHDLDYVFVHMAENDNSQDPAAVEKAVAAWVPKARAAFGSDTRIFLILSLPQIRSAPIVAGVKEANDTKTYVLDPGTEFSRTVFSGGPTWAAPGDGIHLDAVHQSLLTAFVTKQAQECIDGTRPAVLPDSGKVTR